MHWVKEVEMVDSVDELRSSSSVRGIQMPYFEVLDAGIASALNRIIQNSHFKRRISLEEQKAQKVDRFLRGRQIAYLIYEYFGVIGANDSVENYAEHCVLRYQEMVSTDESFSNTLSVVGICWQSHTITGRTKAETLGTSTKQASKEQLKNTSKQLVMKFMLQLHKLPKCLERKCGKEWVLSNIKQSKLGLLIKLCS